MASCCPPLYWCTAAGVVAVEAVAGEYTTPADAVSGPYVTEAEALAVCGDAWWCVTGATGPQLAPRNSPPFGYTSGPYATAAEAAAVCPILIDGCATEYPTTITVTFSGFTGGCASFNGSVDVDWDGSAWVGVYAAPAGAFTVTITPSPGGGGSVLFTDSYTSDFYTMTGAGGTGACGAYPAGGLRTLAGGCAGTGTVTITA